MKYKPKIGQTYIEDSPNLGLFIYDVIAINDKTLTIHTFFSCHHGPSTSETEGEVGIPCEKIDNKHRIVRRIFTLPLHWRT